ncbi:hypothetical protein FBU59_000571 [Linderina macrospora]|uniref:Uncharacterized protein n=1 Tax=Linderina macrospora TaxID=4868 RepID=A0ACC1JGB0_9FUNG|nr:hypothetical protein FBU59_000571 [Linderina macrospora]
MVTQLTKDPGPDRSWTTVVKHGAPVNKGITQRDPGLDPRFTQGKLTSTMQALQDDVDPIAPIPQDPPRRILNDAPRFSVALDATKFDVNAEALQAMTDHNVPAVMVHIARRAKLMYVVFASDEDADAFLPRTQEVFGRPVNAFCPIVRTPHMAVVNIQHYDSLGNWHQTTRKLAALLSEYGTLKDISLFSCLNYLHGEA